MSAVDRYAMPCGAEASPSGTAAPSCVARNSSMSPSNASSVSVPYVTLHKFFNPAHPPQLAYDRHLSTHQHTASSMLCHGHADLCFGVLLVERAYVVLVVVQRQVLEPVT
jgi:hypothetical protein